MSRQRTRTTAITTAKCRSIHNLKNTFGLAVAGGFSSVPSLRHVPSSLNPPLACPNDCGDCYTFRDLWAIVSLGT
jgi:hypothetical protein